MTGHNDLSRSSCGCSAATRHIAPWHLHVTWVHLHLSSVQLGYENDKTRAPHTSLRTAPRGSKCRAIDMEHWLAKPASPAGPLGFVICWMIVSMEMYASICRRNDESSPETKSSMRSLKTR